MPTYNSPFVKPQLLQNGVPAYFFGGFNFLRGNGKGTVASVALTSNVATVTVTVNEGPLPLVGDWVTIWGTTSASGAYNVTRAVVTAVSFNTATNTGTATYALTSANLATTADPGQVLFEPTETAEALTNNSFSAPIVVQSPRGDSQFTLPIAISFPSLPTTATVNLEGAIRDNASEYTPLGIVAAVVAGAQTVGPFGQVQLQRGYVYRLAVTGVTGGSSPTLIAKIG